MSGIFAAIPLRFDRSPDVMRRAFAHLVDALESFDSATEIDSHQSCHTGCLGSVRPKGSPLVHRFIENPESGTVLMYLGDGRTDEATLRRVDESEDYSLLEGFFTLVRVVVEPVAGTLQAKCTLVRDRSGSFTLAFRMVDSLLIVAPRVCSLHLSPPSIDSLDPLGLGFLLSSGFIPGAATQFKTIRTVEPGTAVTIDGAGGESVTRYWQFPPGLASQASSGADLLERTVEAFESAIAANYREPSNTVVFLSGGVDSRAIVAGCIARTNDAGSVHTVSWGRSESVKGTDAYVAAALARQWGTRHQFLEKRCLDFDQDFAKVCRMTDWLTDVSATQPVEWRLMRDLASQGFRVCLRGDQAFSGDRSVHTPDDAQSMATLYRLSFQTLARDLLNPDVHAEWSRVTEAFLHSLPAPVGYTPNDLRDLYRFEQELPNMHQIAALYKSAYMDHRSPILDDHFLAILRLTRASDRTHKALFRKLEAKIAERVAHIPHAAAHSDPENPSFFVEGGIARQHLLAALDDASSPVFDLFDRQALIALAHRCRSIAPSSGSGLGISRSARQAALNALSCIQPQMASRLSHRSRASSLPWYKAIRRFLVIKHFMDTHFRS